MSAVKPDDRNPNKIPDTVNAPPPGPAQPVVKPGPKPDAPARPPFDRGDGVSPVRRQG